MTDKYERVKSQILSAIQQHQPVPIDTNVVIEAAERRDAAFIQILQAYDLLAIHVEIYDEIVAQMRKGKYDNRTKNLVENFLKVTQKNIDYSAPPEQTLAELNRIVSLIPRKLASYATIEFIDLLIKKYEVQEQSAGNLQKSDLSREKEEYTKGEELLKSKCEERYLELIDTLKLSELEEVLDEKMYFKEVENKIREQLKDINAILDKKDANITSIKEGLLGLKTKLYETDINYTAWAVDQGMHPFSMDSDVEWLFAIHAMLRS